MELLNRLLKGSKEKVVKKKEQDESAIKEQLKSILYEDELVEELLPVFSSLSSNEGFEKVMELLVTKEQQLEALSSGNYFKQESEDSETNGREEEEEEDSNTTDPLLNIIEKRVGK